MKKKNNQRKNRKTKKIVIMSELENNFSISLNKEGCKLGIGNNWVTLNQGTDAGDRKPYIGKDERGIAYRIYFCRLSKSSS